MGKEIERKFLTVDDSWREMAESSVDMCQGYLCRRPEATVRVRVAGEKAWITVKGKNHGAMRNEWEYGVPVADALEMLSSADMIEGNVLSKTRHIVWHGGRRWEIDEFHGIHEGLVVAEVELEAVDAVVAMPPFIGREVTGDTAYYNSILAR
ncbi:MAG: CYTH domain-containing protein [Muribaculaceae bacterium]|jgi:Uncharacterized protein conserved in bacteria|nr:CYTH domain-containing protein [Muribaculaceae bacterium]